MSSPYKPVLLNAFFTHADQDGRAAISDLTAYFRAYYEGRRERGDVVENSRSLFCRETYTDKEIERLILSNPFKRFEDMDMMHHSRTLGLVEMDKFVWKRLTAAEKEEILQTCDEAESVYTQRLRSPHDRRVQWQQQSRRMRFLSTKAKRVRFGTTPVVFL